MNDFLFKIVLLGDQASGKTTMLKNSSNNYNYTTTPTIGVDFFSTTFLFNGKTCKIHVWDTSGNRYFNSLNKIYFNTCVGALLFFNLNDLISFENIDSWINQLYQDNHYYKNIILIGTIKDNSAKKIPKELIQQKCNMYNACYFEKKLNEDILDIFGCLVDRIFNDYVKNPNQFNNLEGFKDYYRSQTVKYSSNGEYFLFEEDGQNTSGYCNWCNSCGIM